MIPSWHILLTWYYILVPVIAFESIAERVIWFDQTCYDNTHVPVSNLWNMVKQMKSKGLEAARGVPDQDLYGYIFKAQSRVPLIIATLEAISDNVALTKEEANTLIFCDDDERFQMVSDQQLKGNAARQKPVWLDSSHSGKPIYKDTKGDCKSGGPGQVVLGAAYCDNRSGPERFCSITLCNQGIKHKSEDTGGTLTSFQNMNADFTRSPPPTQNGGPTIDYWVLLDTVLFHEITHTIFQPLIESGQRAWVDKAYRWNGITKLSAAQAIQNADSLAYIGLGGWIENSGSGGPYKIRQDGSIGKR